LKVWRWGREVYPPELERSESAGGSPASATFLRVLRLRRLPLSQLISKLTPIGLFET
jgi:hypothetical protein